MATRARLVDAVGIAALDAEVRSGWLVQTFPRAYCRPWEADRPEIRERAALTSVGPPATLSHRTVLRRLGLLDDDRVTAAIDVTVPEPRRPRTTENLVVHRARRFPPVVRREHLIETTPAAALVDSWPLLPVRDRRSPVITAVRDRLVTADDLRTQLARCPRLAHRRELGALTELLAAGCESELEIWGLLHVFDVPGLRHGVRQYELRAGGKLYRLDLAYPAERVAVELDGWKVHGSRASRERDMQRDAAFASVDWMTLRFSWWRAHDDIAGCRRDTLATLAARRP